MSDDTVAESDAVTLLIDLLVIFSSSPFGLMVGYGICKQAH